jgi:hypothetical protein
MYSYMTHSRMQHENIILRTAGFGSLRRSSGVCDPYQIISFYALFYHTSILVNSGNYLFVEIIKISLKFH